MLSSNDKEILLYRILSGKTFFYHSNEKYLLLSPSLDIKYEAALLYDNIINDEKFHDWFREENAEFIMMGLGLWNKDTNKNLKMLENKLDTLKVELFNNFVVPSRVKQIRINIKNTKNSINKIYSTKQNFISNTLEGYANSIKNEYIICNTLYKDNNLVFNSYQNHKSFSLFNAIVQEIDKLMINTEQFKELARDSIWRSYWSSSKNIPLFKEASINLSDEQRALINISKMYDNIYEHPECPNDAIINDDDALEGWMILQRKKNETAKKTNAFDSSNSRTKNAGEVFVMAEAQEDIESILDMNSLESRSALKEKLNYIESVGVANDGELPDVQRNLQQTIRELNRNNKRK